MVARRETCRKFHAPNVLLWSKATRTYPDTLGSMNWTSTQHPGWADQCLEFASKQMPFRLDHVSGQNEGEICDQLCAEHNFRQQKRGSSVLFTPVRAERQS